MITGANGQLGSSIRKIIKSNNNYVWVFCDSTNLDITNSTAVEETFSNFNFDFCVNCAAYTNVDGAEDNKLTADNVNVKGVFVLAKACLKFKTKIIHISTDFVFDGLSNRAYKENDTTSPLNYYGKSKLEGENIIKEHSSEYFIIRTSWLYSEFGKNFYKTMLNLAKKQNVIKVVSDQIGCPTYAPDLARVIVTIINSDSKKYGIYHFSNNGVASWYDFACGIFKKHKMNVEIIPISSNQFKSKAKRPNYSLLNNNKIKNTFDIKIPHWQESLDTIGE